MANQFHHRCMGCMREKGADAVCAACNWREGASAPSVSQLPPRSLVNGAYLLGRVVGEGGFGITYIGWDLRNRRRVAVKEYFPRTAAARTVGSSLVTPLSQSRNVFEYGLKGFSEESRVLMLFRDHPCIVSFLDFQNANGTAYLVMEFLDGMTLRDYLRERGGRMACEAALNLTMRVLDGLREVHSHRLLHRDLSPDNIFITKTNGVKLLDFGAARFAMGERSQNLSVILKPGYAPPEQYLQHGRQGPETDIYAAAATLYRALTGEVPPAALDRKSSDTLEPPSRFGVAVEPYVERALMRAMSLEMRERFSSAQEFQEALRGTALVRSREVINVNHLPGIRRAPNVVVVYVLGTILGLLIYLPFAWPFVRNRMSIRSSAVPAPAATSSTAASPLEVNYRGLSARLTDGQVVADVSIRIRPFQGRKGCVVLALVDKQNNYVESASGKTFELLRDFKPASDRNWTSVHFLGEAPPVVTSGGAANFEAQAILYANPCDVSNDRVISRSKTTPLQ